MRASLTQQTSTGQPLPSVSICVPTYNGRKYLAECIKSIRRQTFTDFEVVVCDDQSSDGTLELARHLAEDDSRFRFISNARRLGLVGNWNNCIQLARGEWIKFVFQDDIIKPSCLETLLEACRQTNSLFGFCEREFVFEEGVSMAAREWFEKHREEIRAEYQATPVIGLEQAARIAFRKRMHNLVGEPTVTLINQTVFSDLGVFDEALVHMCDAEFWYRVMINRGAVFVPERLAVFRVHKGATTKVNMQERSFRTRVLDPVVLRHRFAFGRHFKPVRRFRVAGMSTLSRFGKHAIFAAHAWRDAKNALQSGDNSLMLEWCAVNKHCVGLKAIAWLGRGLELIGWRKRMIPPDYSRSLERNNY